jgi:hypothetical protein
MSLMRIAAMALLLGTLFPTSAAAGEGKRAEAEALFSHANSLLVVSQPSSPYSLKGHVRFAFGKPVEGTLLKSVLRETYSALRSGWLDTPRWWFETEREWVQRTEASTPVPVRELLGKVRFDRVIEGRRADELDLDGADEFQICGRPRLPLEAMQAFIFFTASYPSGSNFLRLVPLRLLQRATCG